LTKRLVPAVLLCLIALPLFAAVDMFIKFEGVQGDAIQSGHAGWFEVASFSWGASPNAAPAAGPACGSARALNFTRKGSISQRLSLMCKGHAQLPQLTVEVNGERHLLQNVTFGDCTSQPLGDGNAFESYSLDFARCATHSGSTMPQADHKDARLQKADSPNAILIGLTPRPEGAAILSLNFLGTTQARLVRKAGGSQFRMNEKIPQVSITLNNGQKWTFTDVTVSFTGGVRPGTESFSLNFSKMDGPLTGFQDIAYKE